ncbi:MAG: RHS repeat-associated core domain-containing protein [Phycisphaeraceae bacterium]
MHRGARHHPNGSSETTEHVDQFCTWGGPYTEALARVGMNSASLTGGYDANGNLTYDGTFKFTFDAWNRLIKVTKAWRQDNGTGTWGIDLQAIQTGSVVQESRYDGLGRRIVKIVDLARDGNGALVVDGNGDYIPASDLAGYYHYYNGWSMIETRDNSANTLKQQVWGLTYIDELVQIAMNDDPADEGEQACESLFYAMHDANFNVLGIVDSDGVLVERYEYTPYGQRAVYFSPGSNDPDGYAPTSISRRWQPDSGSGALGPSGGPYGLCEFGHQGLMHEEELSNGELIQNRHRVLHARLERFVQQDPFGYAGGIQLYQYINGAPTTARDPSGLVPSTWTFSGINNYGPPRGDKSQPERFNDYVGDVFTDSEKHWWSQAGTEKGYDYHGVKLNAQNSRRRLDEEASTLAALRTRGEFCNYDGSKTVIRVLMISPKTATKPPKGDACCCDIEIELYWDPYDGVPNQGLNLNRRETQPFWEKWGHVNTVQSNPADPRGITARHRLDGFLHENPELDYYEDVSREDSGYRGTGKTVANPLDIYKRWRSDPTVDYIFVCHSQGCNIAMHVLGHSCTEQ